MIYRFPIFTFLPERNSIADSVVVNIIASVGKGFDWFGLGETQENINIANRQKNTVLMVIVLYLQCHELT